MHLALFNHGKHEMLIFYDKAPMLSLERIGNLVKELGWSLELTDVSRVIQFVTKYQLDRNCNMLTIYREDKTGTLLRSVGDFSLEEALIDSDARH